jgi:hypothetical protein
MATQPAFATVPKIGAVNVATADSTYTGTPTNVGTVITGGSGGTRIAEVVVKCAATSAAAVVRLWLFNGTTYTLFDEIVVAAATGSATVAQTRVSTLYSNLVLPSSAWSLRATTSVSQSTNVIALGADL